MVKKVVSPEGYRRKSPDFKLVEVPSGAIFKIREIDVPTFGRLQEFYSKMPSGEVNAQNIMNYLPELARILLPAGIEEPRVVENKASENALSVDEIRVSDKITLIFEIMDFSGISDLAEKLPKSFRRRTPRKAHS